MLQYSYLFGFFFPHGIDDVKCLGVWFWGNYGGAGLLVGLDDLEDLLQL